MESTSSSAHKRTAMEFSTLSNSCPRNPGMPTPVSIANNHHNRANKRRRISPPSSNPSSSLSAKSSMSQEVNIETPQSSAPVETMSLRLTIPKEELTKDEQRTLSIRRAAAERWKSKLQNPFPKSKEINSAYKMKLLRHYRSTVPSPEPDFIKPRIEASPRVTKLLQKFPKMHASNSARPPPAPGFAPLEHPTPAQILHRENDYMQLRANKNITKSEWAQRLAWQSFSATENDRIDRGREAMMESGLVADDLVKEDRGLRNGLPEWRKAYTGQFAKEEVLKQK